MAVGRRVFVAALFVGFVALMLLQSIGQAGAQETCDPEPCETTTTTEAPTTTTSEAPPTTTTTELPGQLPLFEAAPTVSHGDVLVLTLLASTSLGAMAGTALFR